MTLIIDISSPYSLASANHPGQNSVGNNMLRNGNYNDWKSETTNPLFTMNKIRFVDGPMSMPIDDSIDKVRRTITTMHQEGMNVSMYYTKLRSVWDEIQSIT